MSPYLLRYYSMVAAVWDVLVRAGSLGAFPALHAAAAQRLRLEPGGVVVDVGCGTGLMFRHLLDVVGPAGRVIGIDASPAMLAAARRRIDGHGWKNVELRLADADRCVLPRAVDGVVFAISLSSFLSPEETLRRFSAALKPGGRMVVVDSFLNDGGIRIRLSNFYTRLKARVVGSRLENRIRETAAEVMMNAKVEIVHSGLYSIISGTVSRQGVDA